jgi:hypothetical protein
MYAMQYELRLPADYDMEIIRKRVRDSSHITDEFTGLGLKAYLLRERGVAGSLVNEYAPFYLWQDVSGMNEFLWGGGGFRRIVDSFGRPTVRHWTGVGFRSGPANSVLPKAASKRPTRIAADAELESTVEVELAAMAERAEQPGVFATALAIEPQHWELVHFTLWAEHANEPDGIGYEVLHLSSPHLAELPAGRHW